MAKILKGKPVADAIIADCAAKVSERITEGGKAPKLAVVAVGEDSSNDSYLNGIAEKSADAGVLLEKITIPEDSSADEIKQTIIDLNDNDNVHGVLLMRPLPAAFKDFEPEICETIASEKDVDAARMSSLISSYVGSKNFAPCTAEAIVKILDHYNVDIEGKHAVVVGRSLVVGKPLANMLLNRNATVTMCHSRTQNMEKITKAADIVILATGTPKQFGAKFFSAGQTVIDAGINWDAEAGKLCGDADFDAVEPKVAAITPVPGGVGTVTSAVLISHTI